MSDIILSDIYSKRHKPAEQVDHDHLKLNEVTSEQLWIDQITNRFLFLWKQLTK